MASAAAPVPEHKPTREPKNSRFTQQELPALKPLLTPVWVSAVFFVVAVVFIPIGAACLAASAGVTEISARYDDTCIPGRTNSDKDRSLAQLGGAGTSCNITLTAPSRMKPPIYLYYELQNYYQNHRRYVKSRSDSQLRGSGNDLGGTSDCAPEQVLQSDGGSKLIMPCGLIAWSYFNDTYAVTADLEGSPTPVAVDETGIAWESDIKHKFGSQDAQNFNLQEDAEHRGGGTITGPRKSGVAVRGRLLFDVWAGLVVTWIINNDVKAHLPIGPINADEHFIVWMRTAALSNFRKLWGRIDTDLPMGTNITIAVANRYNTYRFNGEKHVVLSTSSWLGGKNNFLGIAYIVVGGISFLSGCAFFLVQWRFPRQRGDVSYLSWNANAAASTELQ